MCVRLPNPKVTYGQTMKRLAVQDILNRKAKEHTKITALTAYDFPFARLVDQAGIDIVLVGDSVGMVCLGYETTSSVVMNEMIHHAKAVKRALRHALCVVDMPYGSYDDPATAVENAKRLVHEGGADAVKPEGGKRIARQIGAMIKEGIQVMGHLGMTPQSVSKLGGYKVQGKTEQEGAQITSDAKTLEGLGVFSIVLECIPHSLGKHITESLRIPTIGIGAGPDTDGQVLVIHDLLGFQSSVHPRFVRRYADLDQMIRSAVSRYRDDVMSGAYPSMKESFS